MKLPPHLEWRIDQDGCVSGVLPPHEFRIGENRRVGLDQLPDFRPLVFFIIGRDSNQSPSAQSESVGRGLALLGWLIADAAFKLLRPWPLAADQKFLLEAGENYIDDIGEGLISISPESLGVRDVYLARVRAVLDIALHRPDELPAILTGIGGLSNERLTERAHAILTTSVDPGRFDLWTPDDFCGLGVFTGQHLAEVAYGCPHDPRES